MKLQVLLATMHQKDHSVLDSIGLQSSAIVVNQADRFDYEQIEHKGNDVLFLTLPERGVGLSRNTALMRSDADIALFSDESVIYDDGYSEVILEAFRELPQADMIIFNVPTDDPQRKTFTITKESRVRKFNSLRYGAVRIAVRVRSIRQANLSFPLLFGGGAKYSSGEDSMFIYEAIRKGLKIYAVPQKIGRVRTHRSTWFNGYTDQFFMDKGALFKALSPRLYCILILQFILRKKRTIARERSFKEAYRLMLKGARRYAK